MKRIAIYPFDKTSHGIVRFRDLLEGELVSVIDFVNCIGKDAMEEINGEKSGIIITDDMEKGLSNVDLLILNEAGAPVPSPPAIEWYNKHNLQERWMSLVKMANEKGIEVISVYDVVEPRLVEWIKENNYKIGSPPVINYQAVQELTKSDTKNEYDTALTKIGIYGTNSCIGKFTTQMTVFREISKYGKAAAVITEPTAFLFGQPQFVNIKIDEISAGEYMESTLEKLKSEGYEYVISSGQSGLSFTMNRLPAWVFFNIIRLLSFNPDIVFLISGIDDDEELEKSMKMLKLFLGKEKPDAILMPDKKENTGRMEIVPIDLLERRKIELKEKYGVEHVEIIRDVPKILKKIAGKTNLN